ncbi:MAG: hypothetical protein R3F36_06270 [Candidatus Competibacteraceae bacterium]
MTAADESRFRGCRRDYHDSLRGYGDEPARLRLGRELYAWLDGDAGWLACSRPRRWRPGSSIRAPRDPDGLTRLFLQLPWELLADDRGHLAMGFGVALCAGASFGRTGSAGGPFSLSVVAGVHGRRAARPAPPELRGRGNRSERHGEERPDLTVEESGAGVVGGARGGGSAGGCPGNLSCHGQGVAPNPRCVWRRMKAQPTWPVSSI